ncbi:DUF1349 domain-containing protein, partial [Bacillus cereus]
FYTCNLANNKGFETEFLNFTIEEL